jgi:lysophospholipase L1-like esterase
MKKLILIIFFLAAFSSLKAQEAPFYKDIQNFKKQDSVKLPPKDAILFIGSSTFTKWKDVQDYFPEHVIINRGFGGSSVTHLILYIKDIVYPYAPRQVVIYCGENDFMVPGTTAEVVSARVNKLFDLIREKYPKVPIAYISIKPSPSREKYWPLMKAANQMIADHIAKIKNAKFINTYDAMFNTDGSIKKEIFLPDNLHMNAKGYAIWQKIMEPYLK